MILHMNEIGKKLIFRRPDRIEQDFDFIDWVTRTTMYYSITYMGESHPDYKGPVVYWSLSKRYLTADTDVEWMGDLVIPKFLTDTVSNTVEIHRILRGKISVNDTQHSLLKVDASTFTVEYVDVQRGKVVTLIKNTIPLDTIRNPEYIRDLMVDMAKNII
jgi:hypothetical protein